MTQEDERIARKLLDLSSRSDRVQLRNGMTYLDGYALGNGTVELRSQVVRDRRMRMRTQETAEEAQSITFSALFENAAGKLFVIKSLDIGLLPDMTVTTWPTSEMIEIGDGLPIINTSALFVYPYYHLTSLSKTDFVVAVTYSFGSGRTDSGRTVARFYRKNGSSISTTDIPSSLFSDLAGLADWVWTTMFMGISHNGGWCQYQVEDTPNFGVPVRLSVTFDESGIIAKNGDITGGTDVPFVLPTVEGEWFEYYPDRPVQPISNVENTIALRLFAQPYMVYRGGAASELTIGEGIDSPWLIAEDGRRFFQGENLYHLQLIFGPRYAIKHLKVIGSTLTLQGTLGEVVLPSVPSGYSLVAIYPDLDGR